MRAAGVVLGSSDVGIMKSPSSVISFKLQTQGCELLCNDASHNRVKGVSGLQHKRGRTIFGDSSLSPACLFTSLWAKAANPKCLLCGIA